MEVDKYSRVLHTIEVLRDVLQTETIDLVPGLGLVRQSVWSAKEENQIKQQMLGMLKLIPEAKNFNDCFE